MKLNSSETQLKKIKSAHSKRTGVTIQLSSNQIGTGKREFILPEIQVNKLNKSKRENKGSRLELKCEQIKQGGFLPLLFAGIGAASALARGVSSIANTIIVRKHKIAAEKEQENTTMKWKKLLIMLKLYKLDLELRKRN